MTYDCVLKLAAFEKASARPIRLQYNVTPAPDIALEALVLLNTRYLHPL